MWPAMSATDAERTAYVATAACMALLLGAAALKLRLDLAAAGLEADSDPLLGLPPPAELQRLEASVGWNERLHAQPAGADPPRRLADGCYHVFLDVGSNRGNHVRFLFEPDRFPLSFYEPTWQLFSRVFGPRFADADSAVCVFAFEPNPSHAEHLVRLARHYRAGGRRVEVFGVLAGARAHRGLPMQTDADRGHAEWGFHSATASPPPPPPPPGW